MNRQRLLLALLLIVAGWQAVQWWQLRPVRQSQGVLAADEPEQVASDAAPIQFDQYTLKPRASYRIRARVLSRKNYRLGREADLSPVDFALGWGLMSDSFIIDALDISQSGRFFWMHWDATAPAPESELMRHAANVHLIPASKVIRRQLAKIRPGQVVELQGLLVDAASNEGWNWNTSLTREDTGAGACELFWVQHAEVLLRGR
ncbi:MAG: hypothetical protein Q7J29_14055 [Stagnimonas sp.]|nr:hypothetical protein [Stagnimonas sp.]